MTERLERGPYFRILTVIDQFTWECPLLWADHSLTGPKVVACFDVLAGTRRLPLTLSG
jgi:hypothetical protein